jgi:hypothetical protein
MRSFRQSFFVSLCALSLSVACGDDGSGGSGNQGGTGATGGTGGTPSDGGSGATGPTGGTGGTGAGTPVIPCADVEASPDCTDPSNVECVCNPCADFAECVTPDGAADCICDFCAGDGFCTNPANCADDGECDPYNEGCLCADCAAHPECAEGWIEDCGNGMDDNGNDLADCNDPQCQANPACEEICDNEADDNNNTLVDCDDTAFCLNAPPCVEPACTNATVITAGAPVQGSTAMGTTLINTPCAQEAGAKEFVYTYTPTANGHLKITLASAADLGVSVRTTCNDSATQTACVDQQEGGTDEVAFVNSVANTPLTIIVDGYNTMEEGAFTITLVDTPDGTCLDDMVCAAVFGETCTCADCAMAPVCGFCDMNEMECAVEEACTCDSCDADMFCTDPANCTDDDFCDQFNEGCQCADCAMVPNCTN